MHFLQSIPYVTLVNFFKYISFKDLYSCLSIWRRLKNASVINLANHNTPLCIWSSRSQKVCSHNLEWSIWKIRHIYLQDFPFFMIWLSPCKDLSACWFGESLSSWMQKNIDKDSVDLESGKGCLMPILVCNFFHFSKNILISETKRN